ncbi:asparagine synthase (glutamine-hydrolyzing) [Sphingomonas aliaeris]|uniref:asparagine synthase (glutamine-hydrolyzing) n=1 Tax=Sphingomonas aliaeris TaxID=2759526 RepID=A0A974NX77_9SPHN|nr:asparagine synthase (glutamine-hydrolyzing) [Sphingomonas aliaeris]QQV78457.1 asparagine synthase (glutamine-hydrolyzing) [Sphingomonas aliaeris]
MCGIAGFWSTTDQAVDAKPMADALLHRGPDAGGAWSDEAAGIALAHRRLAIIDLSPAGAQPMTSPEGRYVIVYNGEIYNHLDLRAELESTGPIAWNGHSDTETLVHGIARWGLDATLKRAVGMFAIAVWDRQDRTLSLARDRMGEKPLFYGWGKTGLMFGSELKALRQAPGFDNPVNPDVLSLYLRFNYVPSPWSILHGIFKLEPGVIATFDRSALEGPPAAPLTADGPQPRGMICRRYWSLDAIVAKGADAGMTEADALSGLEQRLTEAVRQQAIADVPVGAFLSGGVDSSAIVALMRNVTNAEVKTFTIGFAETGFDEAPHARAVAEHLGTDHHEMYVDAEDVRAVIPDLARIYDEPFADSSQIPTVLLSRLTRRSVTVALSGDAGDELFCGYNRYLVSRGTWDGIARIPAPVRGGIGKALTSVSPSTWDKLAGVPLVPKISMLGDKVHKLGRMLQNPLSTADIYRASSEEWAGRLPLSSTRRLQAGIDPPATLRNTAQEQMMHWDMQSYLPNDILTKVDRAAMSASLETRVPLLDHRVVEQAWRTPLQFKMRDGQGKWALRQILYRYVPKALIERPKAGFAIPIGAWLRGPLRDWAEGLLSEAALAEQPALDAPAIRGAWAQHLAGTHDRTASLWGVLMFQAWSREWGAR